MGYVPAALQKLEITGADAETILFGEILQILKYGLWKSTPNGFSPFDVQSEDIRFVLHGVFTVEVYVIHSMT